VYKRQPFGGSVLKDRLQAKIAINSKKIKKRARARKN